MSLKEYKATADALMQKMQMFCIDPDFNAFKSIVENVKMRRLDGFDEWASVAHRKYSKYWVKMGYSVPHIDEIDVAALIKRARLQPRMAVLVKLWHCFYADGSLDCLRAVYEIIGDETGSNSLRETAAETYRTIRRQYTEAMNLMPDDHIVARIAREFGDVSPLISRTIFKSLDDEIEQRLAIAEQKYHGNLDEFRTAVSSVASSFRSVDPAPTVAESVESVESVDATEVSKASRLFDKLASQL